MAFGALQPINRGPAFWILESKPAVWLGKVSYGLYLYHWPIILYLTPERTGLDGNVLAAFRLAVSLAVTALSWYLIEQPVLRRKPAPWPMAFATVTSMAVIFAGLLWVEVDRPPEIEQIIVAAPAEPGDESDTTAADEGGDDPADDRHDGAGGPAVQAAGGGRFRAQPGGAGAAGAGRGAWHRRAGLRRDPHRLRHHPLRRQAARSGQRGTGG